MIAIRFAARNLLRQPGRTALGVLGIAAVGALLFDMLLLSRGLVVSFRDLLDSVGFDIRVAASELALPGGVPLKDATVAVDAISALPEVDEAVAVRTLQGEVNTPTGTKMVPLLAIDPGGRRPWTVVSGVDLDQIDAPAILVNENLQAILRQPVGGDLQVRLSCDRGRAAPLPRTFRVAGVAQFPFDDESQLTGLVARSVVRDACGGEGDEADLLMVASSAGASTLAAVRAIRAARPDLAAVTNEQIVARVQTQGFTYFRQISAVLSTITLLFGFLLITVLLTVSVNQRLGEIAALRALGFSAARAAVDVFCQGAMLVGAGGLLALPLGVVLSIWLDGILKAMPGIPAAMHFFVFEARTLAWHAGLLIATAVLASAYPMWIVARLPIASTLRNEVVS
ncbi:MAG: ABC transporter permease [Vicinamibacterales bacterium]